MGGQLATLQAGVSDPSTGSATRGGGSGSLTVVGGRSTSNTFLLDGTNIMDGQNQVPRSAAGVQLGSDAVLEVEVLSTQYGPEYGRTSGGVLNSITRSGTPEFHGTLFEYLRNSKLDGVLEIPRSLFFIPDAPHLGQISVPSMTPLGTSSGQPSAGGSANYWIVPYSV